MKRYCDPFVSPSVCLSPGRAAALGYWHAGCLQPSQVRTADPSADGRRSAASRTAISGGHIVPGDTKRPPLSTTLCAGGQRLARVHLRQRNSAGFETMVFHPANCPSELGPFPVFCHYTSTVARVISFSTVSVTTLFIMKI